MEEWKFVGRILVKGFLDYNIFFLNFVLVYVMVFLFGEYFISEKILFDFFFFYLSKLERDLVKVVIERKFFVDENEDFLDMFDRFGSKIILIFENM